jgi:hypothetical protein
MSETTTSAPAPATSVWCPTARRAGRRRGYRRPRVPRGAGGCVAGDGRRPSESGAPTDSHLLEDLPVERGHLDASRVDWERRHRPPDRSAARESRRRGRRCEAGARLSGFASDGRCEASARAGDLLPRRKSFALPNRGRSTRVHRAPVRRSGGVRHRQLEGARVSWPSHGSIVRLTRAEALHVLGRAEEERPVRDRRPPLRLASTTCVHNGRTAPLPSARIAGNADCFTVTDLPLASSCPRAAARPPRDRSRSGGSARTAGSYRGPWRAAAQSWP